MRTEYALRALYELSTDNSKKPLKRTFISQRQHIPVHFLETILISLKKRGLVKSVKGPGGGYMLNKDADNISIWDIYSAVDTQEHDGVKCFPSLNEECERIKDCKIKPLWFTFNDVLEKSMSAITLQSLLKDENEIRVGG